MRKILCVFLCVMLILSTGLFAIAENSDAEISQDTSEEIVDVVQTETETEEVTEKTDEAVESEENEETNVNKEETTVNNQPVTNDSQIDPSQYSTKEWDTKNKENLFALIPKLITPETDAVYKMNTRKFATNVNTFNFTEESHTSDCEVIASFLSGLIEIGEKYSGEGIERNEEYDYFCTFTLESEEKDGGTTYYHELFVYQKYNTISIIYRVGNVWWEKSKYIYNKSYNVSDPEAVADYWHDFLAEQLWKIDGVSYGVSRDKSYGELKLAQSKEDSMLTYYHLIEKLEFDITYDGTWWDTDMEKIAEKGDVVHCTVEQWRCGMPYYFLTLETNKGTIRKWRQMGGMWSFKTNNLYFMSNNEVINGNRLIARDTENNRQKRTHTITVYGKITDGEFQYVSLGCKVNSDILFTNGMSNLIEPYTLKGSNIKYEYYQSDEYKNGNVKIDLVRCFSYDKEAAWEEFQNEPVAENVEIDYEHMETELKTYDEDGNVLFDVEMRYAAKMKLDEYKNPAGWCAKLGDDIEVTLVGMLQTLKGEPRMTYPMIRFKGSKGTVWFDSGTIMQGTDKDVLYPDMSEQISEDRMAYVSFHSLISFENKVRIRNSVSYDSLEMYMTFTDETRTELESIKLKLPGKDITIKVEDMNYIGGGEYGYESWL